MAKTHITVQGNLCAEPVQRVSKDGLVFMTMRIASTPRRRDRESGQIVDEATSYYNVTCFRGLARNAACSLHRGDPVIVHGTLSVAPWTSGEKSGLSADIVASSIGHDLTFGVAGFHRSPRPEHPGDGPLPDSGLDGPGEDGRDDAPQGAEADPASCCRDLGGPDAALGPNPPGPGGHSEGESARAEEREPVF